MFGVAIALCTNFGNDVTFENDENTLEIATLDI